MYRILGFNYKYVLFLFIFQGASTVSYILNHIYIYICLITLVMNQHDSELYNIKIKIQLLSFIMLFVSVVCCRLWDHVFCTYEFNLLLF